MFVPKITSLCTVEIIGEIQAMANKSDMVINDNKIKTFRWLFYISLFQLLACLTFPIILFPIRVLLSIEILNALTVGLLFGLYFLGVNIYGMFIDERRRPIYIAVIMFISAWTIWTIITWLYIEHMYYLT
jgi:hypothetical protein